MMTAKWLLSLLLVAVSTTVLAAKAPIFTAIADDSPKKVRASLEADPNALDQPGNGGQTPLMNAVLTGKVNAVKALIKAGADPSIGEKDGYTPMHGAGRLTCSSAVFFF